MNKSLFFIALAAGLALSGCAELSKMTGKSASVPIEERSGGAAATSAAGASAAAGGGKAATATAGAKDGAAKGSAEAGAKEGAAKGSAEAGATTSQGLAAQQVETRALPGMATPGKALDSANPMVATTEKPAADPRLKDATHLLSRRVIYFDFDSSAIREEYRELIEAHAGFIKANKGLQVILQGHTDERGSRDYNLALGQRRSESVRQALGLLGVRDEQMEAVSLGEEKPVQEGHDEAAWQQNRRTEIHYQGE